MLSINNVFAMIGKISIWSTLSDAKPDCVRNRCASFEPTTTTLALTGPSSVSVCLGYPPGYNPSSGRPYDLYPQLVFTVTNAPPSLDLVWDRPSDATPVPGLGAPSGPVSNSAAGQNWGINSPAIRSGDEPQVFISNLNDLVGIPPTSTTGAYGAGNNINLPCLEAPTTVTVDPVTGNVTGSCCQRLRFSVSPADATSTYVTGYKDVTVCYEYWATCTIL